MYQVNFKYICEPFSRMFSFFNRTFSRIFIQKVLLNIIEIAKQWIFLSPVLSAKSTCTSWLVLFLTLMSLPYATCNLSKATFSHCNYTIQLPTKNTNFKSKYMYDTKVQPFWWFNTLIYPIHLNPSTPHY